MNPDHSKLRQQQHSEEAAESQLHQQPQAGQEFPTVEDMLRFDAQQNVPAASISERLKESIAREPPPPLPWWKRLFGRT